MLIQLLDDKSNIHDQGITNNALIYYKLKKGSKFEIRQTLASGRISRRFSCENDVVLCLLYVVLLMFGLVW